MPMQPPVFNTSRLHLRPLAGTDIPAIQQQFADYEVIRHLSRQVPWPYPADGARDFVCNVVLPVQGTDRWVWALCPAEQPGQLIGLVDLWRHGRPEHRGFWLARQYWGRGLMSEALVPLTDWAFDGIGFDRLIFANARGNLPSRRLKEKAGARLLRTEPGEFIDPAYKEREVWELSREDWLRRPGQRIRGQTANSVYQKRTRPVSTWMKSEPG